MKTAAQSASKWATNLAASTAVIQSGVEGVRVAPGQAAARAVNLYVQRVTENAQKFARKVSAVSLSDWQQAMINKGIPRIATGAQAAQSKFETFMTSFLGYVQTGVNSLPQRGTLDQNIARMTAMVRHLANYKGA